MVGLGRITVADNSSVEFTQRSRHSFLRVDARTAGRDPHGCYSRDMPSKCVLAAIVFLSLPAAGQRMYSTGAIEPSYRSAQEAAEAERHLESHPDDRQIVQRLLDYHVAHWESAGADRLRVVLWTIEHHPGIDLEG